MSSPMLDLTGEHWPITVNAKGDGPVEPGPDTREVCAECGKTWPCDSFDLINDLRAENKRLQRCLSEAQTCLSRVTLARRNVDRALGALDGEYSAVARLVSGQE